MSICCVNVPCSWFSSHLGNLPKNIVKTCCPFVWRIVRLLGIEEALVVRSVAHFALWVSTVICLVFIFFWASHLSDLSCYSEHCDWSDCCSDLLAVIVFVLLVKDSCAVLACFDDNRQLLLQQKRRTLDNVSQEARNVLERARENLDLLEEKVVDAIKENTARFSMEVFQIVLPTLQDAQRKLRSDEARELGELRWQLTGLCWEVLKCIQDLTDPLMNDPDLNLARQHSVSRRDDVWKQCVHHLFGTANKQEGKPFAARGRFSPIGPVTRPLTSDDFSDGWAGDLAEASLEPLQELFTVPKLLGQRSETAMEACSASRKPRGSRFGLGIPPWGGGWIQCRAPLFLSVPCRLFCAIASCNRRAVCKRYNAYPKHFRLGPFWAQLTSELHERLLLALLICVAALLQYCWEASDLIGQCLRTVDVQGVWQRLVCVHLTSRKITAASVMCFNIPAMVISLSNIENLDAVFDTMHAIWQLEDIQNVVGAFITKVDGLSEHLTLLQSIEACSLQRMNIIFKFGRCLVKSGVEGDPQQVLCDTRRVVDFLSSVAAVLKVSEWHDVSEDERIRRTAWVTNAVEEFGFERTRKLRNLHPLLEVGPTEMSLEMTPTSVDASIRSLISISRAGTFETVL
uniref:Uncharacterized protein n=1 Tax=Noctiluca scintillans TaxID=2966 RepID=A0A7S0ZYL4_NOCSC|mmetsp:Transcript_2453/g.7187  ORF Transcript_2453/g.7187 Transcript_2453/m.7187 type:complete len:628 (+) Transcript_2453:63-1946(+)